MMDAEAKAAEPVDAVSVKVGPCDIVIIIRGGPHLILRRADITSVESWISSQGVVAKYYFIEFATKNGIVTCDYDNRPLWEEIMTKLAAANIFNQMQGEPAR